jgi:hypothetical protein
MLSQYARAYREILRELSRAVSVCHLGNLFFSIYVLGCCSKEREQGGRV